MHNLDEVLEELFQTSLIELPLLTGKPLDRVRAVWLAERFVIRGRPWREDLNLPDGEAAPLQPHSDMYLSLNARNELRIYQCLRRRHGHGFGFPINARAVWGELAISETDRARLREARQPGGAIGEEVPHEGRPHRRAAYAPHLITWLVPQSLRDLQKSGPEAKAKEFWDFCHEAKPELVSLLPKRWRPMVNSVRRHIQNRPRQQPTTANKRQ
jgi:hypothetical protein